MAHDAPQGPAGPTKLVIRNIGLLLSGDLSKPILDADTVVALDGRITAIGREKDVDTEGATTLIDANGTTLTPGLIDSHVHPVAGDWTPRQSQINWIDSSLHGGVTTMISAGEVHYPGRARDVVGVKALAITAQRAFSAFRPSGVKVHAGAPVIENEMVEDDFKELAAAGVKLLGEVGLGGVKDGPTARKMVGSTSSKSSSTTDRAARTSSAATTPTSTSTASTGWATTARATASPSTRASRPTST